MTRVRAAILVVTALTIVTTIDRLVGPTVSMMFFNALITCFAAWTLGAKAGAITAVVNVGEITLVNGLLHHADAGSVTIVWNLAGRLASHMLFVLIASGLRETLAMQRWLATSDALTGTLNRRAFIDEVQRTAALARRQDLHALLAYVDLDGFKHVNDRRGHAAGDALLQDFTIGAREAIRDYDLLGRIGGDEFAFLMLVQRAEDGTMLAEQLHDRLTARLHASAHGVTCSMGAVVFAPGTLANAEAGLARADGLMYEVKHNGRNAFRLDHVVRLARVGRTTRVLAPVG